MAEYHVGCGAFGIYAGTLEPKNKSMWRNKSDVTEEAIEAVRDHMVMESPACGEQPHSFDVRHDIRGQDRTHLSAYSRTECECFSPG